MKLSFSAKVVVVSLLIGVCSTQANARRLYKWVDQSSVTNYSEFKPKEGSERKLQVLESRGSDHVDPAMAVTAEMKPLEIPVDQTNTITSGQTPASVPVATPTTQTIVKQGVLAEPYIRPASGVVATQTPVEKKEPQSVPLPHPAEKKEVITSSVIEKPSSTVAVVEKVAEKKEEVAIAIAPEKKIQPKINPWTRTPEFVPSNLVPENLPKGKKASVE